MRAHEGSERREDARLEEELDEDLAVRGAERLAEADLVPAVRERDQHDGEDTDAADEEHGRCEAREDDPPAAHLVEEAGVGRAASASRSLISTSSMPWWACLSGRARARRTS